MACPRSNRGLMVVAVAVALAATTIPAAGEIIIRDGDSIAFVGDSNTAGGWILPSGYVRFVMQALEQEGVKATPIPAGVAGDTSERMRNRIDGVLAQKPTWLTLSTGFNDVSPACGWQVGFEDFKKHVTTILDKSRAAGVKVIILTPTLYGAPDDATNQKAAAYVDFLRQMAKERNLPLADLNAAHRAEFAQLNGDTTAPPRSTTYDGIHMNPRGNMMMATGVLKTLGLTDEQIAEARKTWLEAPYRKATGGAWLDMTAGGFANAEEFAARERVPFRTRWESFAGGFEKAEHFAVRKDVAEDADANPVLQLLWERALVTAARAAPPGATLKAVQEAARIQFGKDLDALPESKLSMKDLQ